jgi:hypothetical protein
MMNYFIHLAKSKYNGVGLVGDALAELELLHSEAKSSWYNTITEIFNSLNIDMSQIFNSKSIPKSF